MGIQTVAIDLLSWICCGSNRRLSDQLAGPPISKRPGVTRIPQPRHAEELFPRLTSERVSSQFVDDKEAHVDKGGSDFLLFPQEEKVWKQTKVVSTEIKRISAAYIVWATEFGKARPCY